MTHPWRFKARLASALLLALAVAVPAQAACSVSSSGLAFGVYQPLTHSGKIYSVDVTSVADMAVACTGIANGGSYTIALGPSTVGGGDGISTRYLANTNGGDLMRFNLHTDPTYATVWGNGATGSVIGGSIPVGDSNQSQPVYGKIPAGQYTLRAGNFEATVTMTLTYNP